MRREIPTGPDGTRDRTSPSGESPDHRSVRWLKPRSIGAICEAGQVAPRNQEGFPHDLAVGRNGIRDPTPHPGTEHAVRPTLGALGHARRPRLDRPGGRRPRFRLRRGLRPRGDPRAFGRGDEHHLVRQRRHPRMVGRDHLTHAAAQSRPRSRLSPSGPERACVRDHRSPLRRSGDPRRRDRARGRGVRVVRTRLLPAWSPPG